MSRWDLSIIFCQYSLHGITSLPAAVCQVLPDHNEESESWADKTASAKTCQLWFSCVCDSLSWMVSLWACVCMHKCECIGVAVKSTVYSLNRRRFFLSIIPNLSCGAGMALPSLCCVCSGAALITCSFLQFYSQDSHYDESHLSQSPD